MAAEPTSNDTDLAIVTLGAGLNFISQTCPQNTDRVVVATSSNRDDVHHHPSPTGNYVFDSGDHQINVSTSARNSTYNSAPASKIITLPLFLSCIIGTITNNLYLILCLKTKKAINTLFFHLILSYFISTLILPFMATSYLQETHWSFGTTLCEVFNGTLWGYLSLFSSSAISLDQYLFLHEVGTSSNKLLLSSSIVLGIWIPATALSTSYLAFQETYHDHKERVTC
ncbi:LOW QUALITY PROTEIN: putative G-protein coupled receptor 33 [Thomomys bottae]